MTAAAITRATAGVLYSQQKQEGRFISAGISSLFMDCYNVLLNLPGMTDITDEGVNTFLFMTNDTTHEPMLLQEPDYEPAQYVDNTEYEKKSFRPVYFKRAYLKDGNREANDPLPDQYGCDAPAWKMV